MKSIKVAISRLMIAVLASVSITAVPLWMHYETSALAKSVRSSSKLSDDLKDKINKTPGSRVSVILQLPGAATGSLRAELGFSNGLIHQAYDNINAMAVELPAALVEKLASRLDVEFISLDRPTHLMGHLETTTGAALARSLGTTSTGTIDGNGIGIAILDSGIYAAHHSFGGRVAASVDFTGEGRTDDPYGHGTHVAGIAAGNSHVSSGAYTGVAPAAKLINVRVLNSQGQGTTSAAIAGIDWCISNKALHNIRVLNLSLGAAAIDSYVNDPICRAVRRAVDAGLVVCVAAGNTGKNTNGDKIFGAIHSPGIEPSAITVGATNTLGTDTRTDDGVATYSSRGPTRGYYTDALGTKHFDNLIKPDLVAPGNKLVETKSPNNNLIAAKPSLQAYVSPLAVHDMMYLSGTSMSTPAVAGAAALVIQRNPCLTPNLVKAILEYTAQPLAGFSTFEQGAGELNVEGAVRLAGLVKPSLAGLVLGSPLLVSTAPTQATTIAGASFVWGGGIIQKWNFITGINLITKYQGIYGTGTLVSDGVMLSNGVLLASGVLLSQGVMLSQGVVVSDGTMLANGTLLTQAVLLSNGTVLSDGVMISDGTLVSDSLLAGTAVASSSFALMVITNGDNTSSMGSPPDSSVD